MVVPVMFCHVMSDSWSYGGVRGGLGDEESWGRVEGSYRGSIADGRIIPIRALRDINRLTNTLTMYIPPRNIPNISRPPTAIITVAARERRDSRPRLDPAGAGRIVKDDVFEKDVFDIVRFRGVLTDGADWHAS